MPALKTFSKAIIVIHLNDFFLKFKNKESRHLFGLPARWKYKKEASRCCITLQTFICFSFIQIIHRSLFKGKCVVGNVGVRKNICKYIWFNKAELYAKEGLLSFPILFYYEWMSQSFIRDQVLKYITVLALPSPLSRSTRIVRSIS